MKKLSIKINNEQLEEFLKNEVDGEHKIVKTDNRLFTPVAIENYRDFHLYPSQEPEHPVIDGLVPEVPTFDRKPDYSFDIPIAPENENSLRQRVGVFSGVESVTGCQFFSNMRLKNWRDFKPWDPIEGGNKPIAETPLNTLSAEGGIASGVFKLRSFMFDAFPFFKESRYIKDDGVFPQYKSDVERYIKFTLRLATMGKLTRFNKLDARSANWRYGYKAGEREPDPEYLPEERNDIYYSKVNPGQIVKTSRYTQAIKAYEEKTTGDIIFEYETQIPTPDNLNAWKQIRVKRGEALLYIPAVIPEKEVNEIAEELVKQGASTKEAWFQVSRLGDAILVVNNNNDKTSRDFLSGYFDPDSFGSENTGPILAKGLELSGSSVKPPEIPILLSPFYVYSYFNKRNKEKLFETWISKFDANLLLNLAEIDSLRTMLGIDTM